MCRAAMYGMSCGVKLPALYGFCILRLGYCGPQALIVHVSAGF